MLWLNFADADHRISRRNVRRLSSNEKIPSMTSLTFVKKKKKHFKATKDVKTNCTPTSIYNDEHGVEK